MGLYKDKKGGATEAITFAFWIFVISVGIIAIMFGFLQLTNPLRESVLGDDPEAAAAIDSMEGYIGASLPSAGLIIYFALILGMIFTAFFIRQHPIYAIVYILLGMASVIVAVVLGNAWSALTSTEAFSSVVSLNTYTKTMNAILSNIVLITVVVFVLGFIITFAKPGGGALPQAGGEPY